LQKLPAQYGRISGSAPLEQALGLGEFLLQ
jgi:hypothetical protein